MARKLQLNKTVVRALTPGEIDAVGGGAGTGGVVCWSIQLSIEICPEPGSIRPGNTCGPPDDTVPGTSAGETITCMFCQ